MQREGLNYDWLTRLSEEDRIDAAEELRRLAERFLERRDVSKAVTALKLAEGIAAKLAARPSMTKPEFGPS